MRKLRLISFFCLTLAFGLFCAHAGDDMFVVKDGCYLPLFENNKEIRSFEKGEKGCNCGDLDTVLLPWSVIKVEESKEEENGMVEVTCKMTEAVEHKGYVYKSSIEDSCEKFEKKDVKKRSPMSLEEIRTVFESCLRGNVPYCWGSNQFAEISLPGITFKENTTNENTTNKNTTNKNTTNENTKKYELRGFDCSGLLYYISDGTLPHATGALKDFGMRRFTIEAGKSWEVSKEDLEKAIADLKDTDFIAYKGHVIVSYNEGLIEFRSKDLGCCFTSKEGANQRITELIEAAKKKNSDVWFVRWHPEYCGGSKMGLSSSEITRDFRFF